MYLLRPHIKGNWFKTHKVIVPTVQQKNTAQPASETSHAQGQTHAHGAEQSVAQEQHQALDTPKSTNGVTHAIERMHASRAIDQRQEQQLYSSVWAGLAAALIKTPTPEINHESRRRFEQLQHEVALSEEKERKRKRGAARDDSFVRTLATIIGEKAAESINEKINQAQKTGGGSSPQQAAQLAKDIAAALKSNDSLLQLHISTQEVEASIARELSKVAPSPAAAQHRTEQSSQATHEVRTPTPVQPSAEQLDIRHPLNHPVPAIRDAIVQMAQPGVNPSRGMITLPEVEPLARQLMPAAKNLGFQGTRDQFTEALYALAQRVEDGQGATADQIRMLTEHHLTEKHGPPSPHLVAVVTDLLARIQYAKAASLNEGQVAHAILQEGEKPAIVHGQVLADHVAGILEATGEFAPPVPPQPATVPDVAAKSDAPVAPSPSEPSPSLTRTVNQEARATTKSDEHKVDAAAAQSTQKLNSLSDGSAPTLATVTPSKTISLVETAKPLTDVVQKTGSALVSGYTEGVRTLEQRANEALVNAKKVVASVAAHQKSVANASGTSSSIGAGPSIATSTNSGVGGGTGPGIGTGPGVKKITPGAHTALNLQPNPEILLPANSAAPSFKVNSVADLTKQLKELAQKSAHAEAKGDREGARALELEAKDTLSDNSKLVRARSAQEQTVLNNLFIQSKLAEEAHLTALTQEAEKQIAQRTKELALAQASAIIAGTIDEAQARKLFDGVITDVIKKVDPREVILQKEPARKELSNTFVTALNRAVADVQKKDNELVERSVAALKDEVVGAARAAAIGSIKGGGEASKIVNEALSQVTTRFNESLTSGDLHALATRNPAAVQKLRDGVTAAIKEQEELKLAAADFQKRLEKDGLKDAIEHNAAFGTAILKSAEGPALLKEHLGKLASPNERLTFLSSLKISQGTETVSHLIDAYDTSFGTSLAHEIVSGGATPELRKALTERILGEDKGLFTDTQRARAAAMVERHHALTVAAMKKDFENIPHQRDALAKKKLESLQYLDKELATKLANEVSLATALESAIGAATDRFRLPPETTFDELTQFLRARSGEPKDRVTNEQKSAAVVLGHVQNLKSLNDTEEHLYRVQKSGYSDEITKFTTETESHFGGLLRDAGVKLSAESAAVGQAGLYLSGLKSRIEQEKDANKKAALIAERDQAEWMTTSARVRLELSAEKPDVQRAQSHLVLFAIPAGKEAERTPEAAKAAQNVLGAIKAVHDYEKVATEVSYKPRIDRSIPATTVLDKISTDPLLRAAAATASEKAPDAGKSSFSGGATSVLQDRKEKPLNTKLLNAFIAEVPSVIDSNQRKVKDALHVTSNSLMNVAAGAPTTDAPKLLDPEKQRALGAGGTDADHYHLVDPWEGVQAKVQVARTTLSQTVGVQRVEFLDLKKQPPSTSESQEDVVALEKIVKAESTHLSANALKALRLAAESDPELKARFAPVSSYLHAPQSESREILVRLSPEEQQRIHAFASLSAISKREPADLWKEVKSYKAEALGGIVKASTAREKLKAIEENLGALSPEKRAKVLSDYQATTGRSIGATLLEQRPVGPDGREVLVALSGSSLITNDDLKGFFSKGTNLPTTPSERQSAISKALEQDARETQLDLRPLTEQFDKSAQAHGRWTAALQLAQKNGLQAEADKARTELKRIDAENRRLQNEALKSVSPERAARLGLHEHLDAIRNSAQYAAAASVVAPDSQYLKVSRKIADALQQAKPNTALATDLLARGNFTADEMVLVRAQYAEIASQLKPLKDQRRLTGDLAQDLSDSRDPRNLETKRAQLLAVGGPEALREANLILITEGIRLKDDGMTLRGLVVAKSYEGLDYVVQTVRESDLTKKAAEYLNAANTEASNMVAALEIENRINIGEIQNLPGYDKALDLMKSADTFQQGVVEFAKESINDSELVSSAMDMVDSSESFNKLVEALNEQALGLKNSFMYRQGEAPAFIQYVRQQGDLGVFDAAVFEKRIEAAQKGKKLSPEQLARFDGLRGELKEQMAGVTSFATIREQIHGEAKNFQLTVQELQAESQRKYDAQILWDSGHAANIAHHRDMAYQQGLLLGQQAQGLRDIKSTHRAMTVMSVVMVDDVVDRTDRGLTPEHTAQQFSALQERDQKVEWVVARKHQVEEWERRVREQNEKIEWNNFYFDLGHSITKTAVVVGISLVPVPGAPLIAFGVATAWNGTDKVARYVKGSIDGATALRQFGIEAVLDGGFYALSVLKTGKVVASVQGAVPGKMVEVSRRVWKFDWLGRWRDPISLGKNALQETVHHASERMVGETLKREGGMVAEKVLGQLAEGVYAKASQQMARAVEKGVENLGGISNWFTIGFQRTWIPPVHYTPTFSRDEDRRKDRDERRDRKRDERPDERGREDGQGRRKLILVREVPTFDESARKGDKNKGDDGATPGSPVITPINPTQPPLQGAQQAPQVGGVSPIPDLKPPVLDIPIPGFVLPLPSPLVEQPLLKVEPLTKPELVTPTNPVVDPVGNTTPTPQVVTVSNVEPTKDSGALFGTFGGIFDKFNLGDSLNTGSIWAARTEGERGNNTPPQPPPITPTNVTSTKPSSTPPPPPPRNDGTSGPRIVVDDGTERINSLVAEERRLKQEQAEALRQGNALAQGLAQQTASANTQSESLSQSFGITNAVWNATLQGYTVTHAQGEPLAVSTTVALQDRAATPLQAAGHSGQSLEAYRSATTEAFGVASTVSSNSLGNSQSVSATTSSLTSTAHEGFMQASRPAPQLRDRSSAATAERESLMQVSLVDAAKPQAEQLRVAAQGQPITGETVATENRELQGASAVSTRAQVARAERLEAVETRVSFTEQSSDAQPTAQQQALRRAQVGLKSTSDAEVAFTAPSTVRSEAQASAGDRSREVSSIAARTTLEQLEAAAQALEATDRVAAHEADEKRRERQERKRKSQARLRAIILHQLMNMRFERLKKQRMLQLLINLGISEKEYRELVLKIGDMEAQAMAQRRQRAESTARPMAKAQPQAATSSSSPLKPPVRLKDAPPAQRPPGAKQISRAELYARMKSE